jgi:DNA polymerase III subunit epsilon
MREVVFDTETTGRDPDTGDRIVEIACVELKNYLPTGKTFHRYINPERDVPEEVVKIHGLTGRFLKDKKLFGDPDIVDALFDFFEDSPIVAHNAEFDRKFLNGELIRIQRPPLEMDRFIDSLKIARALFPGAANSLDALSKRFQLDRLGFDLDKRKGAGGHGALIDTKILAEVYLQLRGGRERSLSFTDAPATGANGESLFQFERRPQRPTPYQHIVHADEMAAHEAFIAEMGDVAIWKKLKG